MANNMPSEESKLEPDAQTFCTGTTGGRASQLPTKATWKQGQKKGRKTGGRQRGTANMVTRQSREAIIEALNRYGSDGEGTDGMVGFCLRLLREDIQNGMTMLQMITPRAVDAVITHEPVKYQTVADIDADLAQAGLPPMRDIFRIDYGREEPIQEAEVVTPGSEPR
jgi:hypothetical protein